MATIVNAKTVFVKGKSHTVAHQTGSLFQVTSGTSGECYNVRMVRDDGRTRHFICSCAWGTKGGAYLRAASACSHAQAVNAYISLIADGRMVSAWGNADDASRQHRPVADLGDGVYHTGRKVDDAEAKRTLERNRKMLHGDGYEL